MAKLIGHYFDGERGYTLFEIDGLKETLKQYAKVGGQTTETPGHSYEYWGVMPKAELGKLRARYGERFTMYSTQEDMPRFRELVISRLTERERRAREEYEAAAALLKMASGTSPEPEETEGKP